MKAESRLYISILIAIALWFLMFSRWTSGIVNFWIGMSISAVSLTLLAFRGLNIRCSSLKINLNFKQCIVGIFLAFALWGIFWIGNRLSSMIFDFARPQVESVYQMKDGTPPYVIAFLLLFVIGPAEEFFWRGYVQKKLCDLKNPVFAFVITLIIYSLAHIWSGNFMLVMAAFVAGGVWGLIYMVKPDLLPALVFSHAWWDALVFVLLPI